MKKITTIFAVLIMTASVFAQAPEKMSYQAVVRNSSNALVTSTAVGMQISILQDSASGTAVYVETQTPTSNANGLVSLEIGAGTVVSGDFTTIDWANGPYFIKTETDPTGGTSYTITGISQLLSVPFALYAKTAESVTGTITETDPIFGASVASGITGTDTTYWNNKQDQLKLAIGDSFQGGIIFWLDATGQHGLIAATADQSTGRQWHNGSYTTTNAVRDGIGAGMYNTERIIANQGTGSYAAQLCANYQGGGYGDWYLPSKYELNLLYLQRNAVGGLNLNGWYWSSTESSSFNAWEQSFYHGGQGYDSKSKFSTSARAVRAF
jgi:hypothetical protein